MYDVALTVAACLGAGTQVDVAWVVATQGFSSVDPSEAVAITPGGGQVGSLASGALNQQVADIVAQGRSGRLARLAVTDLEAQLVGLACGGTATTAIVPAATLPAEVWEHLHRREPLCLVFTLDGETITGAELFTRDSVSDAGDDAAQLFGRGVSASIITDDRLVSVLWPVPKMLVVGGGGIADALVTQAGLLGWSATVVNDAGSATRVVSSLAVLDKLVVLSHDLEVAGPALQSALAGEVGYIGALGSRHTQDARADWLAGRGVDDLSRVHGPAGLDIGARTPAEIAVSITAEALAVATRTGGGVLRAKSGGVREALT